MAGRVSRAQSARGKSPKNLHQSRRANLKQRGKPLYKNDGPNFLELPEGKQARPRAYLQELVRNNQPIAIILLETRRKSFTRRDIDRLVGRNWSYEVVPSIGKSGGMCFLWQEALLSANNFIKNKQFLIANVCLPSGAVWQLGAVYADKYMYKR
ncbi:hypothetical protein KSP39_PZI014152 [Platanthera zijinensis]|uniref:Uncharacterized protein n=1 Tax=Platanthera zijinensis TaxID=2320716 RepID=A0AAP0G385_9ASPA